MTTMSDMLTTTTRERLRGYCLLPIWRIPLGEQPGPFGWRDFWEWLDPFGESSQGRGDVTQGQWVLLRDHFRGGLPPDTSRRTATDADWRRLAVMVNQSPGARGISSARDGSSKLGP